MRGFARRALGRSLRPLFQQRFFSNWSDPPIEVIYWDGSRAKVGSGTACAELEFRCPSVLADVLANPSTGFGNAYVDVENLWRHYTLTLEQWAANFAAARPALEAMTDEQFMRRWWLYLNGSQAVFATGHCHLWQIVITRDKTAPLPLTREHWLTAGETDSASERITPVPQPAPLA